MRVGAGRWGHTVARGSFAGVLGNAGEREQAGASWAEGWAGAEPCWLPGSGQAGKKGRGVNWARGMLLGQEQGKAGLDYWVGLLLGLGFAGFSSFLFFSFSN